MGDRIQPSGSWVHSMESVSCDHLMELVRVGDAQFLQLGRGTERRSSFPISPEKAAACFEAFAWVF